METLGIIIVIEQGDLEQKTKLLIESIRTFGGEIKDAHIWTVKPRRGKSLTDETIRFLKEKKVEYIDIDLNKKWYLYGFANKIYASAYIEQKFGATYETLVFLDCDTLVVNSVEKNILANGINVAIKPAEEKFIEISRDDEITPFWEMIFHICNVNPDDVWTVTTTVDQKKILACFNAGVIFTRAKTKLFQKWLANFNRLMLDARVYQLIYTEFYLLEQAILAATIVKTLKVEQVKLLDNRYNFPFHFYDRIPEQDKFKDIKILHYHHLFQEDPVKNLEHLPSPTTAFLRDYLPLKSFKRNMRQKVYSTINYIFWRLKNKWNLRFLKTKKN